MTSFKKHYCDLFETLGYPLTARSGLPASTLAAAERRIGKRIPAALGDYHLVAGGERRFNTCHNRLIPPAKLSLVAGRLVFMDENQSVVCWGVPTSAVAAANPWVWQGIGDDKIAWHPEGQRCDLFLTVMLHYQAISGGFKFCGSAQAPETSDYRFENNGWQRYGDANTLLAYSRSNQVACLLPPGDLPFQQHWTIYAGGKTKADLQTIAGDLGVALR